MREKQVHSMPPFVKKFEREKSVHMLFVDTCTTSGDGDGHRKVVTL